MIASTGTFHSGARTQACATRTDGRKVRSARQATGVHALKQAACTRACSPRRICCCLRLAPLPVAAAGRRTAPGEAVEGAQLAAHSWWTPAEAAGKAGTPAGTRRRAGWQVPHTPAARAGEHIAVGVGEACSMHKVWTSGNQRALGLSPSANEYAVSCCNMITRRSALTTTREPCVLHMHTHGGGEGPSDLLFGREP